MPIYEYNCEKCGHQTDVLQKVGDPAPEVCTSCGSSGTMARQVSRTSFVLKGGGWYSDLYSSTNKNAKSSSSETSKSESTTKPESSTSSTGSASGTSS